jgi:hypothetical protein
MTVNVGALRVQPIDRLQRFDSTDVEHLRRGADDRSASDLGVLSLPAWPGVEIRPAARLDERAIVREAEVPLPDGCLMLTRLVLQSLIVGLCSHPAYRDRWAALLLGRCR